MFVWFGALELAGSSPVHDLIAQTLPFLDADLSVPVLGGVETAIGLALITVALVLIGHHSRRAAERRAV